MLDIPCVIFAGGKSSRMGEDKALLPFFGFQTLTEYQLSRLKKIFKTVYISCKDKNKFNFDANFIEDIQIESIYAPTAGFVTVFQKLQENSFFALSVDAPFVSEVEIKKIIEQDQINVDATISKSPCGIQPMCGIYHRSLEIDFMKMLQNNNHKLGFLLKNADTTFVNFKDDKPFLNLNTKDEYLQAVSILRNF